MPYLWYCETREGNPEWAAAELPDRPVELAVPAPRQWSPEVAPPERAVVLGRADDDRLVDTWVLVWGRERAVRVNGVLTATGVKVLSDRDEIRVDGGEPMFFSAESLPRVEIFASADADVYCPRCKKVLEPGTPVVRCPKDKLAYHYSEDKEHNCWSYSSKCVCGHPTAMDGNLEWSPEEMWE